MKKHWKVIVMIGIILFIISILICLFFFTNLFKSTLMPMNIKNISIQYVPNYPLSYEEQKNEEGQNVYELQTITIKDNNFKKIKSSFKNMRKSSEKKKDDMMAKILIDQNTILLIGKKQGTLIEGKKETPITYSESFSNLISSIIVKNNQKILETIHFEQAQIISEGAHITITNKDNIKLLKEFLKYDKINRLDDYMTYDGGSKIQIHLDHQNIIYLYSDHSAYCVLKDTDGFYASFPEELLSNVQEIIDLSTK